jgi:hypothetical protein
MQNNRVISLLQLPAGVEDEKFDLIVDFIRLFSSLVSYAMPYYALDPHILALERGCKSSYIPMCRYSIVDMHASRPEGVKPQKRNPGSVRGLHACWTYGGRYYLWSWGCDEREAVL